MVLCILVCMFAYLLIKKILMNQYLLFVQYSVHVCQCTYEPYDVSLIYWLDVLAVIVVLKDLNNSCNKI